MRTADNSAESAWLLYRRNAFAQLAHSRIPSTPRRPRSLRFLLLACSLLTVLLVVLVAVLRSSLSDDCQALRCRYEKAVEALLPQLSCDASATLFPSSYARPFVFLGTVAVCPTQEALTVAKVDGGRTVSVGLPLPVSSAYVNMLYSWGEPSVALDPAVGRSRSLSANLSSTTLAALDVIREQVYADLFPLAERERSPGAAQLDKSELWPLVPDRLVLYSTGDHLSTHRDVSPVPGQVATVLVMLPTEQPFSGGRLHVLRKSLMLTEDVEWDGLSAESVRPGRGVRGRAGGKLYCGLSESKEKVEPLWLSYAAFYSDCEHEVTKVVSGSRVVLVLRMLRRGLGDDDGDGHARSDK